MRERTVENDLRFAHRTLHMHRRLLRFRSDVAARSSDKCRVGLAVRVAEVETPEVDDRCRDHLLAEVQALTNLLHGCVQLYVLSDCFEGEEEAGGTAQRTARTPYLDPREFLLVRVSQVVEPSGKKRIPRVEMVVRVG